MSMTRSEFNEVVRAAVSKEFADIPEESEIDYEFSEGFLRKMDKLISKVNREERRKSSFKAKNVVALVAAILLMLVGLMSVSAVREPVINFVVKIYEEFNEISFSGDTSTEIDRVYSFTKVPDGFEETQRILNEKISVIRYDNSTTGDVMELSQEATQDCSFALDNKNCEIRTFNVDGKEIRIYRDEYGSAYDAFWIEDTYCFKLIYVGTMDYDKMLDMISTIA